LKPKCVQARTKAAEKENNVKPSLFKTSIPAIFCIEAGRNGAVEEIPERFEEMIFPQTTTSSDDNTLSLIK
jgi:hypothetical protein